MKLHRPGPENPLAGPAGTFPAPQDGGGRGRVLILTAGYGEGHNAAARAVADAVQRATGPDSARVVDVFAAVAPRFNRLARGAYLRLVNDAPQVWSGIYRWLDRSQVIERRPWLFRALIAELGRLLREEAPIAICCTYPLYAPLLARVDRRGAPAVPVFNVVTDSISIHSLWWRAACTGWFVPNADSAAVLVGAGVPTAAVHVTGFPLPAFFAEQLGRLAPPDLTPGTAPRVLQIINSGTRHAAETARRLLMETDWDVTFAVGRDERLGRTLLELACRRRAPTEIRGWTDQIPRLLMTRHVLVSKAGGATTQEAIAARCPLVITQVIPGQEEGNYELIRRLGAGALAESPDAVLATLRDAFAHGGRQWRSWRSALQRGGTPDAADRIARHVLAWASAAGAPPVPAPSRPQSVSPLPWSDTA